MNEIHVASAPGAESALIVGGGIGGLATAYALQTNGVTATLVERAPEFGEVGAGLQLAPNATRILKRWGLLDKVIAAGVAPKRIVFRDAVTGKDLLSKELQTDFVERYGAPYVVVHRTDLHQILLDAARDAGVTLHNGVEVNGYATSEDSASVTTLEHGSLEADVVIGADGIRSALRASLSDDEPVPSGYAAFRGALPVESVEYPSDMESVVVWLGPKCHLVQYPLRSGDMLNTVAVFQSPAYLRGEEIWGTEDELVEAYRDCVPQVQNALNNLGRTKSWPMFDRVPISNWTNGRLGLLGDAAHPMLQYLAQGACQALEDAATLESLVVGAQTDGQSHLGWEGILNEYNEVRAPRTARVQTTARVWGEAWHVDESLPRLLRNMLFESANSAEVFPFTDWLYGAE